MIPSHSLFISSPTSFQKTILPLMPTQGVAPPPSGGSNTPGTQAYLNALRQNPNQDAYLKAESEIFNSNPVWEQNFSYTPKNLNNLNPDKNF